MESFDSGGEGLGRSGPPTPDLTVGDARVDPGGGEHAGVGWKRAPDHEIMRG
jgi:hypothetical protein